MSQHPAEHPSDLTPLQRKYLRNIRGFLDAPPTLGGLYARNAGRLLVIAVLFGGPAAAAGAVDQWPVAAFAAGVFVGIFLNDLGKFRQAILLWPATAAVVDRTKIDHLTDAAPPDREADGWQ